VTLGPQSLNRPADKKDLTAQINYLADLIRQFFHFPLSANGVAGVRRLLWRVGPDNYEDLVSSIFLECWEEQRRGGLLTEGDVVRIADKLRQRLLRSAKKTVATEAVKETPAPAAPPDEDIQLVLHEFQTFLQGRSALDAHLFQLYYLDGKKDVTALAEESHLSIASIYRRLKAIRDGFLARRDLLDPPHFQE
jgi:DNA-directed RNA polymerase specialized sigma24 family protein